MYDMDAQDIVTGQRYVVSLNPTWTTVDGITFHTIVGKYAGRVVIVQGDQHPLWMGENVSVYSAELNNHVYVHPRHLTPYVDPSTPVVGEAGPELYVTGSTQTRADGSYVIDTTPPLDVAAVVEWIRRLDGQATAFAAQRDAALRYLQCAREEWTAEVASAVRERDEARAAAKEAQRGWDQASEAWGQVQAVLPSQPWERASSLVQHTLDHIAALTAEVERLRAAQQLPDVGPVTRDEHGSYVCGQTYSYASTAANHVRGYSTRHLVLAAEYAAIADAKDAEAADTSSDDETTVQRTDIVRVELHAPHEGTVWALRVNDEQVGIYTSHRAALDACPPVRSPWPAHRAREEAGRG